MFERFTREARQVVIQAQREARGMHHGHIGTEHLLLALLGQEGTASDVLTRVGLTQDRAAGAVVRHLGGGDLDEDALGTIGIDVGSVRRKVEATFGRGALDEPSRSRRGRARPTGHIPFLPAAKKAIELSLREAIALHHDEISDGHLLLGLLREDRGLAATVIRECGIDPADVRRRVTAALTA